MLDIKVVSYCGTLSLSPFLGSWAFPCHYGGSFLTCFCANKNAMIGLRILVCQWWWSIAFQPHYFFCFLLVDLPDLFLFLCLWSSSRRLSIHLLFSFSISLSFMFFHSSYHFCFLFYSLTLIVLGLRAACRYLPSLYVLSPIMVSSSCKLVMILFHQHCISILCLLKMSAFLFLFVFISVSNHG